MEGKKKLPILPRNPQEESSCKAVLPGRFPKWLHRKLPKGKELLLTHGVLDHYRMSTVCEEAKCPNLFECYSKGTATFLAMGKECTRACSFCSIDFAKSPKPLEIDEPERIALSAKALKLSHVVVTMVARDDLKDGGASHLGKIIDRIRVEIPKATIEVLTSDFQGSEEALDLVLQANPEIFNHNIETVRELTPRVRHRATYERTLALLRFVKQKKSQVYLKSGLMLGHGETELQVKETLKDLYEAGCDIITMGQYLQPTARHARVKAFIEPAQFDAYADFGRNLGLKYVFAGPFVRSSYNAEAVFKAMVRN